MKYLLVDSNALIHRAYHAYPADLSLKDGIPINAVYGFASLLITAIEKTNPDIVICTFDTPKPTFRHTEFTDYKAHRKATDENLIIQFPLCTEIAESLDIPCLRLEGFEADDLIGTLAKKLESADDSNNIIILTGDSDEYQLVSDRTSIFMAARFFKDSKLMNIQDVQTKLGFDPMSIPDWKALKGDTSDNIPGVSGIGDKVATDLVSEFGTLSNIYQNIDNIKESIAKKLISDQEMAQTSLRLATIDRNVPISLEFLNSTKQTALFSDFDLEKAKSIFMRFEFRTLISKLERLKKTDENKTKSINSLLKEDKSEKYKDISRNIPITEPCFGIVIDNILVGWDLKNYMKSKIKADKNGNLDLFLQNSKLDVEELSKFDFKIAEFLLAEGDKPRNFEDMYRIYLEKELDAKFLQDNVTTLIAEDIHRLKQSIMDEMIRKNLYDLFVNVEMKVLDILLNMELMGVRLNTETLQKASIEINVRLSTIKKTIYDFIGHEFNIGSPKQVGEVLAEELHIPLRKKSRSGQYGTDEYILRKYKEAFPVIDHILTYRELTKLQSTYVEGLSKLVQNGRLHTTYNQAVASTGRLSSSNPNLQNIPKGDDLAGIVKSSFIASDGYKLVSIDYSQQELRILAHLSQEENLIETYKKGLDVHKVTAARIFGIKYDEVTSDQRNKAKTINFGIIYGMGSQALSQSLKIPVPEAVNFITKFFASFPKIKEYYDNLFVVGKKYGYINTIAGRRRSTKALNSANQLVASNAKRELMNFPIQGSAADQTKLGMIRCNELIQKKSWQNSVRLLLQVHDELVFEIQNDIHLSDKVEQLANMMKTAMHLDTPVEVEVKVGDRWGLLN